MDIDKNLLAIGAMLTTHSKLVALHTDEQITTRPVRHWTTGVLALAIISSVMGILYTLLHFAK